MSNLSLMSLQKKDRLAAMRFYNPESGSKEGLNVKSVQRVVLIMGRYVEQVLLSGCLSICKSALATWLRASADLAVPLRFSTTENKLFHPSLSVIISDHCFFTEKR